MRVSEQGSILGRTEGVAECRLLENRTVGNARHAVHPRSLDLEQPMPMNRNGLAFHFVGYVHNDHIVLTHLRRKEVFSF